jgi:hypothetical protein
MSHHIPRHARWSSEGPDRYRSVDGLFVRHYKGKWWAEVAYQLLAAGRETAEPTTWEPHFDRLGPFKRPRNAMVEAERHAIWLRGRHGEGIRFEGSDSLAGPSG